MIAQNMLHTYEEKSYLTTLSMLPNAFNILKYLIYSICANRALSYHLIEIPRFSRLMRLLRWPVKLLGVRLLYKPLCFSGSKKVGKFPAPLFTLYVFNSFFTIFFCFSLRFRHSFTTAKALPPPPPPRA